MFDGVLVCVSAAVKIYVCLWKCRILKSKVKVFFYSLSSNLPISLVQVPSPSHPFSHLSSHFFHFFSYCHFISSFIRLFPSLAFHVLLARGQPFLCVCVSLTSNSSTSFYYHCIHPSVSYSLFLPLSFFSPFSCHFSLLSCLIWPALRLCLVCPNDASRLP